MKRKAYSYIRFSTPEQAKGHSKLRQLEGCKRYCEINQLELATDEEYSFFDSGKSAFSGDHVGENGQLARFLRMVKEGAIEAGSYLIVESLDRLSREHVFDALARFMEILRAGINVVTLADSKVYGPKTDSMEIMYSVMIMGRAHDESNTKALRSGAAWKSKQEKARSENQPIGSAVPLWLTYTKEEGYTVNHERTAVVRRIFQMSISGYGRAVIAKTLNAEGVKSFKGGTWSTSSLNKLLHNRAVLGEYQPHTKAGKDRREPVGSPIEAYFPPIIENATFYAAKAAIEGRRISKSTKQSKQFNIWQGVAKCFVCKAAMYVVNKGKPPKGNTYLICANSRKGLCDAKVVRLDRSELAFRELLSKVDSLALVQDASTKINRDLAEVEGRLIDQHSKLKTLIESLDAAPSVALATLTANCEELIQNLEQKKNELLTALAADRIVDKAQFFAKLDLDSYEGRNRANALLKRLKIQVFIKAKTGDTKEKTIYAVVQDTIMQIAVVDDKGLIFSMPLNSSQITKMREQDLHGNELSNLEQMMLARSFIDRVKSMANTETAKDADEDNRTL